MCATGSRPAMAESREPARRAADEDDLCRLWAAQALPASALVTTDGEPLQVIYPGRRSGAGGPDFRGAILADAAGRVRTGDVELHLRSRDWITHGHRADPAYNAVSVWAAMKGSSCRLRPSPCARKRIAGAMPSYISRSATLLSSITVKRRDALLRAPMNVRMGQDSTALLTRQDGRVKRP